MRKIIRNPIGDENILFRRTTARYGVKGTFHSNAGFWKVGRDPKTGRWVSRKTKLEKLIHSVMGWI